MVEHEHASRYTAGMFMAPGSAVGFFPAYHHFAIPWHDHDFYEMGIVESGSGLHVSATGTEPFRRGTVVLVPPGAGHEYRSCVEMRVLNCFFRAELDEMELAWAFRDAGLRRLFNPTGLALPRSERPVVVRQLDEAELGRMLEALDALRSLPAERRTRPTELGHLLVALDCVAAGEATARRAPGPAGDLAARGPGVRAPRARPRPSLDPRGAERPPVRRAVPPRPAVRPVDGDAADALPRAMASRARRRDARGDRGPRRVHRRGRWMGGPVAVLAPVPGGVRRQPAGVPPPSAGRARPGCGSRRSGCASFLSESQFRART